MIKKFAWVCTALLFMFQGLDAQDIIRTDDPAGWMIRGRNFTCQLLLTDAGKMLPVYYGSSAQAGYGQENASWTNNIKKRVNWIDVIEEVPVRGGFPFKTPAVEVVFPNGVRDIDLVYVSDEITEEDGIPVLKIVQRDRHYPLEVASYFKLFGEFDIMEKWVSLTNTAKNRKEKIMVENLLSGSVVLPHGNYILTHLSGFEMNEFQVQRVPLSPGLKVIESKAFKSNFNAPWFMVSTEKTTKESGPAWFGSVHYSGNWVLKFDKLFENSLQIAGGINFWDTSWTLNPGETIASPKISFGYSDSGTDLASVNQGGYVRKHVLPARFREELRPVLFNGWENRYYDISERQQMELADVAKEIGVELFVIDDGWFKARTASNSGLGNYEIDRNKFPNGLTPVIDHVHGLGMKFGLWVEPESVSDNCDAFVANPHWTFQFRDREKGRYRKMLNLANEDVYNHLLNSLSKILSENAVDYVKWDQNSYLSEPGWLNAPDGLEREARIRHIDNVYRLVDELRRRFPDVAFETCASGGGRVDLGMLSRMDQAWVSDNTDPTARLFIQHGWSMMLPANTMSSWVTSMTRHQPVSLDFRFDVSMTGVLGIGADITKWSDADRESAKSKIALYKKIRPIVQQGTYYSLVSPFETDRSAVQYVADDKSAAVVFCYNLAGYLPGSQYADRGSSVLKLRGLDPGRQYTVRDSSGDAVISVCKGDLLMNVGLAWPAGTEPYKSRIILIQPTD